MSAARLDVGGTILGAGSPGTDATPRLRRGGARASCQDRSAGPSPSWTSQQFLALVIVTCKTFDAESALRFATNFFAMTGFEHRSF